MAAVICDEINCTVKTTGICLLSHPELSKCPHYRDGEEVPPSRTPIPDAKPATAQSIVPVEKRSSRSFHSGSELGLLDAADISRGTYTQLIGVLGCHEAGKTCFLSSLYLLASGNALPNGYLFKGSETLQAFEDRALGLREWEDGKLKEKIVDHTVLADTRQPSLLHLAIREAEGSRRSSSLLLTDLPGEWTDKLVARKNFSEAFRFLHRADGIILVVDGNVLSSGERHAELQKFRNFVERLVKDVKVDTKMPFVILVAKADQIGNQMPSAAEELREYVGTFGFYAIAKLAAAFSRVPAEVKSGTGVFEAIEAILSAQEAGSYPPPDIGESGPGIRSFMGFRG